MGKYLILIYQQNAIKSMLRRVKYFWDINLQDSRNKVLLKYINVQKYFAIYVVLATSQFVITGIFLPGRTVFDCYRPKEVPLALLYIAEVYAIFVCGALYGGWNLLFCMLIILMVAQLKALNEKIKDLNFDQIKDGSDVTVCINTIKGYIIYHDFLLRFIKDLNDVLSLPITMSLGCNILSTCISMYNLPTSETLLYKCRSASIFLSTIVEFFCVYGLPGQFLMDEAAAIGESIYHHCSWYLSIIPVRKYLLMILVRSQYATRITAEGFMDINYTTTVFMLKTAYTFYTFLQTLK